MFVRLWFKKLYSNFAGLFLFGCNDNGIIFCINYQEEPRFYNVLTLITTSIFREKKMLYPAPKHLLNVNSFWNNECLS